MLIILFGYLVFFSYFCCDNNNKNEFHIFKTCRMKVKYDKSVDILYLSFSDERIFESDEEKKDIILDYTKDGKIVGIEVLNASQHMNNPVKVEYEFA